MARAQGTVLKKGVEPSQITIGKLLSISAVEISADTEDVTTLDSPDGYREHEVTLLDAGEVKITGKMDAKDQGQAALLSALNSRTQDTYEISYPTGDKWSFTASVVKLAMAEAEPKGTLRFEASLKISGKPAFTAATT